VVPQRIVHCTRAAALLGDFANGPVLSALRTLICGLPAAAAAAAAAAACCCCCRFDYGVDMLAGFIGNISGAFPVLSCNLDTSAEPALEGLVQRYALIDLPIANITIGVVGLTSVETPETSNPGKAAAEWRELRRRSRPEWACMHWWYTGMWSVECLPAPPWPIPCGLSTCPYTRPSLPPAPAGATVRFLPYNETLGACVADAKAEGADFIIGELRPSPVTVAAGSRQRGTQLQCSGLAIDGCALQAVVAGSWGRGFTSQIVQQARHVASNCSLCAVFPHPALPCSALMQP
jgi:hypothetical protein